MCGILGRISKKSISKDDFCNLNNLMQHRGPDDSGIFLTVADDYQICLGHRRLSILDLSKLGHQPMFANNNKLAIVFNGEIYNFKEIKDELYSLGHTFKSRTDTEVILEAYLEWGKECFARFNGVFAIGLLDIESQKLILARDRVGKKPLYYYWDQKTFIFASELKPILKDTSTDIKIDESAIGRYLAFQYVSENKTLIENISKVPAGTLLIWENGKLHQEKYWNLLESYEENSKSLENNYNSAKSQLKELLIDSVRRRLVADVPVGVFLSGGIDSSLVAAIAQDITKDKIKTFCIGFHEKGFNEALYAKDIANYIGTEHHELYVDDDIVLDMVKDLPKYFDEPMADSSQIPTMLVSKLASQDVKVVLSGDGGDEIFCGYDEYKKLAILKEYGYLIKVFQRFYPERFAYILPQKMRNLLKHEYEGKQFQFTNGEKLKCIKDLLGYKNLAVLYDEKKYQNIDDKVLGKMLIDMQHYLIDDILVKTDRASMKYSIEARCPLLDYRIMEYSFSLPMQFKLKSGIGKVILRDILGDYIDTKLFERPKKGFAFPIKQYLFGPLKEELFDLSTEFFIKQEGLFDYAVLRQILEEATSSCDDSYDGILWSYYVFQKWYKEYL